MRFRLIAPVLISVLITLSGCFRTHTNLLLNPDGSGTISETILFSNAMLGLMEQFGDSTETLSLYTEERLLERADSLGEGVEFAGVEEVTVEGHRGFVATYSFDDINTVRLNDDLDQLNFGEDDEEEGNGEMDEGMGKGLGMDVTFTYTDRR
ncbi:MAG: hypothetical protein R3284_13075, partial [Rubricoccaceae bacterium]|nr:hypothetical protein [Rubricoccaceae bacterium]